MSLKPFIGAILLLSLNSNFNEALAQDLSMPPAPTSDQPQAKPGDRDAIKDRRQRRRRAARANAREKCLKANSKLKNDALKTCIKDILKEKTNS